MICIIIKPVKRIYPSKIFFTINNPLLIIYTPLERPVAPLLVFLFVWIHVFLGFVPTFLFYYFLSLQEKKQKFRFFHVTSAFSYFCLKYATTNKTIINGINIGSRWMSTVPAAHRIIATTTTKMTAASRQPPLVFISIRCSSLCVSPLSCPPRSS